MRQKQRIPRLLSLIEQVMLKENIPFMKVVKESLNDPPEDPFYIEDQHLINSIEREFGYTDSKKDIESKIMLEIENYWLNKPDLRLLQFITNSLPREENNSIKLEYKKDPYSLHDGELFQYLKKKYS